VSYTRERLGELLVKSEMVTPEQLDAALSLQQQQGGKLGHILVDLGSVTEDQLADVLALQKGLPRVTLAGFPVDHDAVALLPERVARRRAIIPIKYDEDGAVVVAVADPLDIEALDEVELRSGKRAVPVVSTEEEILAAIQKYMAGQDTFKEVVELSSKSEEEATEVDAHVAAGADVPIVRLVNQIIKEAVLDRASDVHFEPFENDIRIRYRVDGVLHDVMHLPKSVRPEMTSRLKIMAEMNIAERRRPQDGRIQLRIDNSPVDLRVATLPTPDGESIVIRILSTGLTFRNLEDLGLSDDHMTALVRLLHKPYGAVLIAGPTGSGKSTTMYAALTRINDDTRKIITVEEPVEYSMQGVTQVGVNNAIGLTFASGLRQLLRSDPDVVMVGEIRDPETAEIAVRAALTGHLMLSSIHTNDAPGALARLSDMEVPPYITSSALLAVLAQRLVRRLCPKCRQRMEPDVAFLMGLGATEEQAAAMEVYGPVGCEACLNTGYLGRVGVFELMIMDDEIRHLFLKTPPADQIRALAVSRGMRTLREDALEKVAAGMTSLEELARVVF
jgi:type IV pilus assembly protein PilB